MKPCEICLEKECKAVGGYGSCKCETCAVRNECPKKLQPTIRLTLKCTQVCKHCCFECSPNNDVHMSVDTAKKVAVFLIKNEINSVNIMGGEIFCNPNWREILDHIIPSVKRARIVTNGDWAKENPEFAEYFSKHENCWVAISNDRWHTNKYVEQAHESLTKHNVISFVSDLNETEEGLVPIGRAENSFGLYSMFGCYCHNPEKMYTFLIDEVGAIFKCGFGVWNYANIDDYLEGGFASRFKEFNKVFYNTFISSCAKCIRAYKYNI